MHRRILILVTAAACCSSLQAGAAESADWIREQMPQLIEIYRHFHRTPELSNHEQKTAERIAAELKAVGAEVTTGVGGHGVVAILANGPGPRLMLRTDLDALPVAEQTQLAYASKVITTDDTGADVGVMHACGHDLHMTNLLGVARYLASHKHLWSGTVMLIGQPAEEKGEGARAMLKDGLFSRFPKPDFALAVHVDPVLAAGHVGYRAGYVLANTDSVDIVLKGRGGHGAFPHTTIDPIVEAARLILDLQTIVSREVKPIEPAVVTVGAIHGGTKHNIIGDSCHLQLTVRSFSDQSRQQLLAAIRRKALATAASSGAPEPVITISEGTPSLFNDEKLVARLVPVFRRVLGDNHVAESEPSMGGEDFSEYGRAGVPVFMYRLGSVQADRLANYTRTGQPPPSLHSPLYYPDAEETLQTGIATMVAAVAELLPPSAK